MSKTKGTDRRPHFLNVSNRAMGVPNGDLYCLMSSNQTFVSRTLLIDQGRRERGWEEGDKEECSCEATRTQSTSTIIKE